QLGQFLEWCADASDATGVTVVIEPLRRAESNLINRVSEGAEIARSVARKGVRNLADTYHMEMEQEPLSAIPESADVLFHVHTADSGRLPPGTGTYDHAALFRALRAARYEGSLSIECDWPGDFAEQVAASLVHLRKAASSPQVPGIEII
ncbi:MAG TPA: TIM barrel protein, partial [Chthonomonadales bacterium]|nr:TIM barrel protein [Chthonomonadales bacterium]